MFLENTLYQVKKKNKILYICIYKFFCIYVTFLFPTGGAFPPPPAVSSLLSLLPPPKCFRGPFVKIDHIIDIFMKINIPEQGTSTSNFFKKYFEVNFLKN